MPGSIPGVGLNYTGGFSHFSRSFYDGLNSQSLQLSLTHQLSRHAGWFSLSNSAVLYGSNRATPTLPQTIAFDPVLITYLPTNDSSTIAPSPLSSQASVTIPEVYAALLQALEVDAFLTPRRSRCSIAGRAGSARVASVQYRATRRSTVGVMYSYMHFSFNGIHGSTDSHSASATYSVVLSRSLRSFRRYGGISKYENVFVKIAAIDPAIAAVLGISLRPARFLPVCSTLPNFSGQACKGCAPGHGFSPHFRYARDQPRKRAVPDFVSRPTVCHRVQLYRFTLSGRFRPVFHVQHVVIAG